MKAILSVLVVVGLCLAMIGVSLVHLHDATTMTSPPEAVVENFTREITLHRYSQALKYLNKDLRRRADVESLKLLVGDLEFRVGEVMDVHGEPITVGDDEAEAKAVMKTSRTRFHTARFELSRQSGEWLIESMQF
jgi:hypothetical protein